jgi:hypothetical protein
MHSPRSESGTFADTSGTFADMTGTSADKSGGFADMTGTSADMSGVFADKSGTFADTSGTFADMTGTSADMTGTSAVEEKSFPAMENFRLRLGGFVQRRIEEGVAQDLVEAMHPEIVVGALMFQDVDPPEVRAMFFSMVRSGAFLTMTPSISRGSEVRRYPVMNSRASRQASGSRLTAWTKAGCR